MFWFIQQWDIAGDINPGSGEVDIIFRRNKRVGLRDHRTLQKAIDLYETIQKSQNPPAGISKQAQKKSKAKLKAAGATRWITVHPNNREKGVPVMIHDNGDGTAHVVGGAGGSLNMLKLNNIKSPEEYKQKVRAKKEKEREERAKEKEREKEELASMSESERKEYREGKKAKRAAKREKIAEAKRAVNEAEEELISFASAELGWEYDTAAIDEQYEEDRKALDDEIEASDMSDKQAAKEVSRLEKGYQRALDSYRKNYLSQVRDYIRGIQKEALEDEETREQLEERLGDKTGAEEQIRTEDKSRSKGFQTGYLDSATGKGGLDDLRLSDEKREIFETRMQELEEENPQAAQMVRAGLAANREINAIKRGYYSEDDKETYERKSLDELDKKADALKRYLSLKKKADELKKVKKTKDVKQLDIDGNPEEIAEEVRDGLRYGNAVKLDFDVSSEDFARSLESEQERLETERDAARNRSLLDALEESGGNVEKWIANGIYNGFNSLALAALKTETIDRDVVDVLGIDGSSKILSEIMRRSLDEEELAAVTEGVEDYHAQMNAGIVEDAVNRGSEYLNRAESITGEIEATNPDDLHALEQLNQTRLEYLDEANRIMGQALGSLEASAAMVTALKAGEIGDVTANLGAISSEDAVIRARALGLQDDEYDIQSINGERILTVQPNGIDRLARPVDGEEVRLEHEVDAIKSGAYDEEGWLPDGVVSRPPESFEDPGPDAKAPEGHIDNQDLASDAHAMKKTTEALHRTLGAMPEGRFALKELDELSTSERNQLRAYWEREVYGDSAHAREATRKYQTGEGKSKQSVWGAFSRESGGDAGAMEAIKRDLMENHGTEDMFGMKDPPPLAKVDPDNPESARGRLPEAASLFEEIDGMRSDLERGLAKDPEKLQKALDEAEAALPSKVRELYDEAMRNHYFAHMSGVSEDEFAAGAERQERTPWGEYLRMHGSPENAYEAVLDQVRGSFLQKYTQNHSQVHGKPPQTESREMRNRRDHVLGMLGREERDRFMDKIGAESARVAANVRERRRGKFASGSVRDRLYEAWKAEQEQKDAGAQDLFGAEDIEQDDGTTVPTLGKRAEAQLKSMVGELSETVRPGEQYKVFPGMNMDGKFVEKQRALKMFESSKRMNVTFGTGKGKTLTSISAFTMLKGKGKAKRGVFAVPSVVQAQFGTEANIFLEPGKYKWNATPGLSRDDRIAALKDGKTDMVVTTHQSLRDDLIYVMSKHQGQGEAETKKAFNAASPAERRQALKDAMEAEGISFDMLTVDESHYTTSRKGKADSTLTNVMDALNQNVEYFMNQSATPVKNDVSEAWDMLHKVAPEKFPDRDEFIKRYGVDTQQSRWQVQRLLNRYNYASPTETGVQRRENKESVQLSDSQRKAYDGVLSAFDRARKATRHGKVDVEAMQTLSPNSFANRPESEHRKIAEKLQPSVGVIKEEALNRVVNQHDWQNNAKVSKVRELVASKVYEAENKANGAQAGDRKPGVIFAHNIASVENMRQALEADGLRVGVIQGSMTGAEKEKVKNGFRPTDPSKREYDVVVLSDAGATGLNLQNAGYLINYDLPQTSWVKQQREGRIDRHGQAHDSIDYHDIVTDTEHESTKWDRIQRKKKLGSVFEEDPGALDDTGAASFIAAARQARHDRGEDDLGAA